MGSTVTFSLLRFEGRAIILLWIDPDKRGHHGFGSGFSSSPLPPALATHRAKIPTIMFRICPIPRKSWERASKPQRTALGCDMKTSLSRCATLREERASRAVHHTIQISVMIDANRMSSICIFHCDTSSFSFFPDRRRLRCRAGARDRFLPKGRISGRRRAKSFPDKQSMESML